MGDVRWEGGFFDNVVGAQSAPYNIISSGAETNPQETRRGRMEKHTIATRIFHLLHGDLAPEFYFVLSQ